MAESVDCVVIGAGVVGLACARALALQGREVIVLERAEAIGTETSSRHSEVIHAGIYYEPGSLKAKFCVEGKLKMYRFMEERGIPFNRLGKLIVATSEDQIPALQQIKERAEKNGVMDLEFLSHNEVVAREPELRCVTALWSPSTGVADSHSYMLGLQGDAEARGAMIAFFAPVERGEVTEDGIILEVGGEGAMTLKAKTVVNAAGLHTQSLTHEFAGFLAEAGCAGFLAFDGFGFDPQLFHVFFPLIVAPDLDGHGGFHRNFPAGVFGVSRGGVHGGFKAPIQRPVGGKACLVGIDACFHTR